MSDSLAPSTPPRLEKSKMRSPMKLATPQSTSKKTQNFFSKMNSGQLEGEPRGQKTLAPVTPDFTPQKSPRLSRKKNFESIFKFQTPSGSITSHRRANSNDNAGIFLPTPSTVGSGRKCVTNQANKVKPVTLKFDTLLQLNDGLKFETDEEEAEENFFLKPSTGTNKFMSNLTMLKSPTKIKNNPFEIFDEPSSPTPSKAPRMPETPRKQVINDQKVYDWHGKSEKYFDDEEEDDITKAEPLVNPFLSSNSSTSNASSKPLRNVNYDTHLELVHNKTGERKVVKLSDRQTRIKPKKLNFSL